jgi:hypothetical protein
VPATPFPGPDDFGYEGIAIPPVLRDVSATGTFVSLSDDQLSAPLPIGFSFDFYGISYSDFRISSNGFITLGSNPQSQGCCTGQPIPSLSSPNNFIAGFWEDLNSPQGNIRFQTLGSPGSRQLVVGFYSVPHFSNGPRVTWEVVLHEGNNNIEIHCVDCPSDGGAHTIGIEDPTGTIGLEVLRTSQSVPPSGWLISSENCFVIDAIGDQFSVINDGTTADLGVLANDECDDDTPISVVACDLPDRGGSCIPDGTTVSYTPAAGFVGFEEFTYTAQDAGLEGGDDPPAVDQDTATVVVDVLEDLIPDAVDDTATTLQTQAVIIDVLANDSLGNAPNEVAIDTGPANGSATLQADDTIRYVPNITFIGEDTFEYRLTDANGDSDAATVTVGVFFVNGQVPIDIMPNSDGNNLNLRAGQGAGIDIAILSVGEFFDAPNEIDPLTLKFGPREANIWGSPQVRDVEGDGDEDLVVKFLIQQTGIPCGATHAILFGRTFDVQPISGMDTINTFNCPRVRKRH